MGIVCLLREELYVDQGSLESLILLVQLSSIRVKGIDGKLGQTLQIVKFS